ncbi:MAG: cytochrome c3 family protein [Desulfuromonadaceae bacterium]
MKKSVAAILVLALYFLILPLNAGAVDAPHLNAAAGYTCATCHTSNLTLGSTGYNNTCLSCHRPGDPGAGGKPITLEDAANPFNNHSTNGIIKMQTSHRWDGPDTVKAAGAQAPLAAAMNRSDLRARTGSELACVRCHDQHTKGDILAADGTIVTPGKFLRVANDKDQMCLDCHRSRNVQSHLQGSHPVVIDYNSKAAAKPGAFNNPPLNSNSANPTSDLNARLTSTGGQLLCTTCHGVHFTDSRSSTLDGTGNFTNLSSGDGFVLRTDRRSPKVAAGQPDKMNICSNCHASRHNHNNKGQDVQCNDCHSAHVDYNKDGSTEINAYLIRRNVTNKATGAAGSIFFTKTGSQRAYKNDQGTGVCQGCHVVPAPGVGNAPALHNSNDPNVCNACHSHNNTTSSFSVAGGNCAACHGDAGTLVTNAHSMHVSGKGYSCDTCHSATVTGNSTIKNPLLHGDNSVEIAGSTITIFNSVDKTCATSCHGSAKPSWTNKASGACGSCHAALATTTGGVITSNGHNAHFNAAYGPALAGNSINSCTICHLYTAATHVNKVVDLATGACTTCHRQSTNWATGRVSCESCHSTAGGELSVIGGITAPDKTSAAVSGHGKAGITQACTACHDNSSSHISGTPGDNKRLLSGLTGSVNAECNFCHTDSARVTAQTLNVKAHRASGPGSTCADCHNAHGTANSMMVNATINGTAVSFSGSSTFANGSRTGVCQVCHSAPIAYFTKAGQPQANHVDSTTNCLECHKHNPATGFAFEANRACDACHGYPPAPRVAATPVAFGIAGSWPNARFEDYSGGGGAHLVAAHIAKNSVPSDAWKPCLPCHSGGAAAHAKALPLRNNVTGVTVNVDSQYRFDSSFTVYTSGKLLNPPARNITGSCFNISCHMSKSPRWSIER